MRARARRAGPLTRPLLLALGGALALAACEDGGAPIDDPELAIALRPDAPNNPRMFSFEPGEVVETLASAGGHFLVHYTRAGTNSVPPADVDMSGVPDFAELVATTYEDVYVHYQGLGFKTPVSDGPQADNGGDERFDVYLVDFNGQGDGHYRTEGCVKDVCTGFMSQENDFKGYGYPSLKVAVETVASHEYFHAIQAAYDANQGAVLSEGTATWGTESFKPTLDDFENLIPGYLSATARPLDEPTGGATDPFSYGTALWFFFLEERYAAQDPSGGGLVRGLLERTVDGANGVADPQWFAFLDEFLTEKAGTSFADAFVEFSRWNLFTSTHADPAQGYAKGDDYAALKMEAVTAPYSDTALRSYYASTQYFRLPTDGRAAMTMALVSKTAGDTDGLVVLTANESNKKYTVAPLTDTSGSTPVDTAGADHFIVAVINTATSGDSKKPGLCIGTVDEVATCKAELVTSGAGGSGGGGGDPVMEDGGGAGDCGCRIGADESSAAWALWSFGGGLAYAVSRARRRRARRASA